MKYFLFLVLFWGMSCVTSSLVLKNESFDKPNPTLDSLDEKHYQVSLLRLENTLIHLYLKKDSALDINKIKKAVEKSWPVFNNIFPVLPSEIALVDSDGPIGGGPMSDFIVTLFSTKKMSPLYKTLIKQATGWEAEESTQSYFKKYYAEFADPEQAYIDDIVIHELAHTIFGFGLTKAALDNQDWWFTFGLGLLYDRMVWNQLYNKESPLFSSAVSQWKNHFAVVKNLDQRLIRPSILLDEKFKLSRLQVYGHGKALVFLTELRNVVGITRFDKAVFETIKNNGVLNYDDFINRYFANDKFTTISSLEKKYSVR